MKSDSKELIDIILLPSSIHTHTHTRYVQSFPGVVVEVLSGHSEVEEDISTENEGPVISQWLAINSTEQLEKFMVSQMCLIVPLVSYFPETVLHDKLTTACK